ncbi:MAG TPA: 16S rRNA (guanine(966)-N(2))-methyltransferase RsmD [Clostridiaceae bacterium]|jgi:16S rRNA (guanine966-N2)-methyltransferase|nr:16S rRNA (guanine(966)-N(2))-methyltransferase RsmD [Clostridiaceae bacterium]
MPRIIAGTRKGMNLFSPPGKTSRLTSGRAKEALFSMIGDEIEGTRVLDVFAGSGQIAFEALSRGAARATLIERDRDAIAAINKNIGKTRWSDLVVLMTGDYRRHLATLKRRGEEFDFIYVDPPWSETEVLTLQICDYLPSLLADSGLLVVESERKKPVLELEEAGLKLVKSCQYGISVLSFYRFDTTSDTP